MNKILIFLGIFTLVTIISLLFTCGIIWLICLCFGLTFSWKIAIGIWLIMCLLGAVFKNNSR